MKAKKHQIESFAHLEKILTFAGVTLILIGFIANLYSAYSDQRFIHRPTDLLYYFRYIILLGGGFTIGYLSSSKTARGTRYNQLFIGVGYAVLAMTLVSLFDAVRGVIKGYGVSPTYPWGNIFFVGLPILAVAAALIVAYFSQRKPNRTDLSILAKVSILLSFVIYQVYTLVSGAYYLYIGTSKLDPNTPLWLVIGDYFITPIAIAIVSYLLLNNIKSQFDRSFYSALIGALYSIFTLVLWEFRTDPSSASTNIFSNVVSSIALLSVGFLLWQARKAIKYKAQRSTIRG